MVMMSTRRGPAVVALLLLVGVAWRGEARAQATLSAGSVSLGMCKIGPTSIPCVKNPGPGSPTYTAFAVVDGTNKIAPSLLPAPSSTTLGGVKSAVPASSRFLTGIDSTGAPTSAQPAFSDISGSVSALQMAPLMATPNIFTVQQTDSVTASGISVGRVVANRQGGAGSAAYGFDVSAPGETSAIKAGIAFQRQYGQGGGIFYLCNRGSADASPFTLSDCFLSHDSRGGTAAGTLRLGKAGEALSTPLNVLDDGLGNASVAGNYTVSGKLSAGGNSLLNGTLTVGGSTTLNGSLVVKGVLTAPPLYTNTTHVGTPSDPSTTTVNQTVQHYYSGLPDVYSSFVLDTVAVNSVHPEQTMILRMNSNTGFTEGPTNVPPYGLDYKMAFGAETNCGAGSAPCWAATLVTGFNDNYDKSLTQVTLELDHNNNTAYNCADGDPGVGGMVNCTALGITGASGSGGGGNISSNISLGGYNHVLRHIVFASGGAILADLTSYDQTQVTFVDAGQHINGYDAGAATMSGNYLASPGNRFLVGGATGNISTTGTLQVGGVSSLNAVNASTLNATGGLFYASRQVIGGASVGATNINYLYDGGGNVMFQMYPKGLYMNSDSITLRSTDQTKLYVAFSPSGPTFGTLSSSPPSGTKASGACFDTNGVLYKC